MQVLEEKKIQNKTKIKTSCKSTAALCFAGNAKPVEQRLEPLVSQDIRNLASHHISCDALGKVLCHCMCFAALILHLLLLGCVLLV